MAKKIRVDNNDLESLLTKFKEYLSSGKVKLGNVSFNASLVVNDKARVVFTETAYQKIQRLVSVFKTEVGWHAMVTRTAENEYTVEDVIVYPQVVTGATVTTDQEEYQNWLLKLSDEDFEKLKFHGHSHVNMGTNPSSVDTKFYDEIISQMKEGFYIFLILNKKGDYHIEIYDFDRNLVYSKNDIEIVPPESVADAVDFVKAADGLVKTRPVVTKKSNTVPKSEPAKSEPDSKYKHASHKYGAYDEPGGAYKNPYGSYSDRWDSWYGDIW